jgi:hypothetical protein
MHFPIKANLRTIGIEDDGGIVVEAMCTTLEQRPDDGDSQRSGSILQQATGGARNRFSLRKFPVVLRLARILSWEQFLEADHLRALASRSIDLIDRAIHIRVAIGKSLRLD